MISRVPNEPNDVVEENFFLQSLFDPNKSAGDWFPGYH